MKILYFHQYFSTPKGASGNRSYWMAKALVAAGHDVHVISGNTARGATGISGEFRRNHRTGNIDGFRVTEIKIDYTNNLSLLLRTKAFLKYSLHSIRIAMSEDCDLVFCTSTPLTASLPGIFARIFRRKKFVFEVRDLWPELPRAMGVVTNPVVLGAMSLLEWISYASAKVCIGLSPGIVEGIKKRNPRGQEVVMIPNGSDLDMFQKRSGSGTVDIPGVESKDFVAIFTGAHGEANGLDAVLDCAAELRERQIDNIKLVFIGEGKLKEGLMKRASAENLSNCVFLPPVPKEFLGPYLDRADIGLMVLKNIPAFYYGTSPNKFFDYLAAGLPILNNYPGWLADMINVNNLGASVPPDSQEDFADALVELAANSIEVSEMGRNAYKLACDEFSRDKLAKEFVRVLENC